MPAIVQFIDPRGTIMSITDPKSREQLQKIIDDRKDGKPVSRNDEHELQRARQTGVKGLRW